MLPLVSHLQNHPKLASELKSCPFNALHLVLKHELQAHIETCSDRIVVDREEGEVTLGESLLVALQCLIFCLYNCGSRK